MTKLSILVPVYNEEKTIISILKKINDVDLVQGIEKEIIVVNDCSTDNTKSVLDKYISENPEISIVYCEHSKNKGKGAALHTGIDKATGNYLIIQDADLEYNPNEYNDLLEPILNGYADVVYGSRFMGSKPHRVLFFWHYVGNKFLTFLVNLFSNLNLTDMETCFKLFKTDIIKSIKLKEKRFGFEPEVTIKVSKIPKVRIYEVGISYYGRTYAEGKKIRRKDGLKAIFVIFKYGIAKIF